MRKYIVLFFLVLGCHPASPGPYRDYSPPPLKVPSATPSIRAATTQTSTARTLSIGTTIEPYITSALSSMVQALTDSQATDAAVVAMTDQYDILSKQNVELRDRDIKWQKAYEMLKQESQQQYIDQDIKERNRANWIATCTYGGLNILGVVALLVGAYMLVGTSQKSGGLSIAILGGTSMAIGLGGMYYGRQYAQVGLLVLCILVVLFIILLVLVARKSLTKTKDTAYALADALNQINNSGLIKDTEQAHKILVQSAASTATVDDVKKIISEVTPR